MSENDGINESNTKPYRHPPRDRRVSPGDLKRTIKALTKAVRKERRRQSKMEPLKKRIEDLASELNALRRS
jgi:hypothetical protein